MSRFPFLPRRTRVVAAGVVLLALVAVVAFFAGRGRFSSGPPKEDSRETGGNDVAALIQRYRDRLAETPQDHAARLELVKLLKPLDAESAVEELRKIPPEAAEYREAVWHIAHIATVGQQDDLAEESLLKLNELGPNDLGVVLSLAELYFRTNRYAQALAWAEEARDLAPERAETWLFLSEILDGLNRRGEMLKPLQKAIQLDPNLYPAHANLVFALQFAGQSEAAIREARWCLDQNPEDTAVRRWLAMALRDQGEHETALVEIRKALATAPDDVSCRIVEADLLMFGRKAEEAYQALKPYYPNAADRRDFLGSLARAAAMSGRKEESRRYQQEIVELIKRQSAQNPLDEVNPSESLP